MDKEKCTIKLRESKRIYTRQLEIRKTHTLKSTFIQLNPYYLDQRGQSKVQNHRQSMLCETATKSRQQNVMDEGEVKKVYLEKKKYIYANIVEQKGCM